MATPRERYGIDAPTVVRNLALGAAASWLALGAAWWAQSGTHLRHGLLPSLAGIGLNVGIALTATVCWMIASSLWLKQRVRDRLLDAYAWRGDEQVLDIGCGRGLLAIGAARRLASGGHVTGVDLWQDADLSGNGPEAIRTNAAAARVADRLSVNTGDARALPYPDGRFDVVGSMTAIHNIPDPEGRSAAISEAWRVTRGGGALLLYDIRHTRDYARQLRELGAEEVKLSAPLLLWGLVSHRLTARKPPDSGRRG